VGLTELQAEASGGEARVASGALRRSWHIARRHWAWAIPVLAISVLLSPMVLTDRPFGQDWTNHLWLVWNQGRHISDTGLPTYFLNADLLGAFYPHYAFYGGTLYVLAGGMSALMNDSATQAYIATFALGFAMSYGGWLWLALQAGLRGWRAHVPAVVFVTGAYYLTNAYARGAWPEFVATSAIPLVLASALWLLRAPRWRAGPVFAFLASTVLLTGSHNLTLLWGTAFFAVVGLISLVAVRGSGIPVPWRRLGPLFGLAVLGAGVNGWFLVPLLAHSGDIAISLSPDRAYLLNGFEGFNKPWVVFHPLRHTPADSTTPDLNVQLPVMALIWAAVAIALLRRAATPFWRRAVVGVSALLAAYLGLVFFEDAWTVMPDVFTHIQFAYRLSTYILLCVTALVLIALVLVELGGARRRRNALLATVVLVVGFGAALAAHQVWSTGAESVFMKDRNAVYAAQHRPPRSWYDTGMRDVSAPVVRVPKGRYLGVPPEQFGQDETDVVLEPPRGEEPIITNVAGGPYIVEIGGVERAGRNLLGFTAVERKDGQERGPVRFTVSLNHSPEVVAGIALTLLSLFSIAVLAIALLVRPRLGKKDRPAPREPQQHGRSERVPT
jgi:hypothetical protein